MDKLHVNARRTERTLLLNRLNIVHKHYWIFQHVIVVMVLIFDGIDRASLAGQYETFQKSQ